MSVYNTTTPLPATTLSTTEFRWLVESDWENSAVQAVGNLQDNYSNLLRFSSTIALSTKKALGFFSFGQWVLNPMNQSDQCHAWAVAQLHLTTFRTVLLTIQQMPQTAPAFLADAIGLLISAVIIAAGADELVIASTGHNAIDKIIPPHWGNAKVLHVPILDAESGTMDKLKPQAVMEIVPQQWWSLPEGQSWAKTLHYLRVRLERTRDKTNPPSPYRR